MLDKILFYTTLTVTCLIALLHIIAPLTKTDKDNKLLSFLRKFEELVLKLLIPQMRDALKAKNEAPKP